MEFNFRKKKFKDFAVAKNGISHCPSSNMVFSSGICRVTEFEKAGVPVEFGLDGSASNDS